ncbi:MAG: hypothetical protein KC492_21075 [Myxococcales bacterium]|nr:hypothetical protein [Myxococcales bacterium]
MAAAEKVVKAEMRERMGIDDDARDPGPWYMVAKRWDGGLSIISRPNADKPAEQDDEGGASASGATTEEDGELATTDGGCE